jgi:hypothetical protein
MTVSASVTLRRAKSICFGPPKGVPYHAARAAIVVLGLMALACDSSSSPAPSAAGLNLTGSWSGQLGEQGSGSALRLTWVATQVGSSVSGTATLIKPASGVPASGALTGSMTGSQLTLGFAVPAGGVPGFPACTISGTGSAAATNQSISGTLAVTFTSCGGSGLEPAGSDRLVLAR